jgi:hypothetical protein
VSAYNLLVFRYLFENALTQLGRTDISQQPAYEAAMSLSTENSQVFLDGSENRNISYIDIRLVCDYLFLHLCAVKLDVLIFSKEDKKN